MTIRSKLEQYAVMLFLLLTTSLAAGSVSVTPGSVQVKPGAQVQFSATVSGSSGNIVVWSVAGAGCIGISCGSITYDGLYTAPLTTPNPSTVTVTATSLFDSTQSGRATVNLGQTTQIGVSITPSHSTVAVKGTVQFKGTVTGTSNQGVTWSVSGTGCVSGSCGSISSSGLYTAPATVPTPSIATVTAMSIASPTKSASATVVIESAQSVKVSVSPASVHVSTGALQQFSATVTGSTNTAVTWSISGSGCSGIACGTISAAGLYKAPSAPPNPATVSIKATAVGDPAASAIASATIVKGPSLSVSPSSPKVQVGGQVQFTAAVNGSSSGVVNWSVSGSGCAGIACGSISSTGLYTAPAWAPTPPIVAVTATLLADPSVSASATVTIEGPGTISVAISPTSAALNTGANQQFKATVTGTTNTAVKWSLSGYGCAGATCGTITTTGLYTAPGTVPVPSFINVTATSVADPTQSATATVTLSQTVNVSVTPTSARVVTNGQQQFSSTVSGLSNTAVTWSVSGKGCVGAACGTVMSNGLYIAPTTVPSPAQVTVTATSSADPQASGSSTVTIFAPVVVSIAPPTSTLSVNEHLQFRATVTGTTNTGVSWSLAGSSCSGTTCGTINSTGEFVAPAIVPNPAKITIKATSQADSTRFATASATIVPSNNSKMTGQYAFLFTGFDKDGVYQAGGTLTADGKGKLISGIEDVNSHSGPKTSLAISGSYSMGGDNRGVLTLSSSLGTRTYRLALNSLGTKGRLIAFDSSGTRGTGVIERQDQTSFDPSVLTGGYALSLTGQNSSGQRIGALGVIFPDGVNFISGASLDVNEGGSVSPTFATFNGSYSLSSSGRGTTRLTIPGFDGGTFNFAFYVVSAKEFLLVSIDPLSGNNPIFSGPAEQQSGSPFTTLSFLGPSVFSVSGTTGYAPEDTVGRFVFDGVDMVFVGLDQNSAGNVTTGGTLTGAYAVENNGRGTLDLNNPETGATTIWYLYAIAPGRAFLMDASTGAVAVGEMKAQTAVRPFSNASILGTYLLGSGEPIVFSTPLYSGETNFDGSNGTLGNGAVDGTEDISLGTSLLADQTLTGSYAVSALSTNGRGNIVLTAPSGKSIAVWTISASEVVGLDIGSGASQPSILHFEQ